MSKKDRDSRKFSRKALERVNEINSKYPSNISDVSAVAEEARAWIEKKVQQLRECLKNVKFPSKPSWWETLRLTRNKTAHQTEDFSDEEFAGLCKNVFSNIEKIAADLQSNIKRYRQKSKKKRKFENFASPAFGSENDRKQLVDAMEDMIAPVDPEEVKIEFPKNDSAKNAEDTLSEILRHENTHSYALFHEGVGENIQTDILERLQKTQETLEKENPFFEEEIFVAQQKKLSAHELAIDLSGEKPKTQYHYEGLPSVSDSKRGGIASSKLDFDFYRKAFFEQKKARTGKNGYESVSWKSEGKLEILRRNFISDMEQNLIDRKCYLISFSTGIETLDMSDFKNGDSFFRLVQFLRKSFNRGTYASPALNHAVQMLQKDGYKNADVLMISDFVMGTLPDVLVESIEAEKKKNTEFYSLVIGSSGNQKSIACFNHNWIYDTSDANASRHLAEQLHEIRERK